MQATTYHRGKFGLEPQSRVLWILVIVLLLLRLVVLTGATIVRRPELAWVGPVYEIGTYVCTLLFIWLERARLYDYHVDGLAIWLIAVFKPLQTLIVAFWGNADPMAFPQWPSLLIWVASGALIVGIALTDRDRLRIAWRSLGWFSLGLVAGTVLVVVESYPTSFQLAGTDAPATVGLLSLLSPMTFLYQIGYAAVSEEPLFRGILWGMLRKIGWNHISIWLFQAALFLVGHIFYLGVFPVSFWIIVPVGSLVFGALAWRSQTIASSIAAHSISNAWGKTMALLMYTWLRT